MQAITTSTVQNKVERSSYRRPMDPVSRVLLGGELRRTRVKAHLSLEELAVCIGRSPGAIDAIESGIIEATDRHVAKVLSVCGRSQLWDPTTPPPPAPDSDVTMPPIPRLSALSI